MTEAFILFLSASLFAVQWYNRRKDRLAYQKRLDNELEYRKHLLRILDLQVEMYNRMLEQDTYGFWLCKETIDNEIAKSYKLLPDKLV